MSIEFGTNTSSVVQYQPERNLCFDQVYYVKLGAEATYGPVFINGSVDTYMFKQNNSLWFDPFQMTYLIGAGVRVEGLEIGWKHSCFHPIITYNFTWWDDQITPSYEGGFDQFYLKYTIKSR